jgi:hypothetical protein
MQTESGPQSGIVVPSKNGPPVGSDDSQIAESKESQVKPVEITFLKIYRFHVQAQPLLAGNFPAFKASDEVILCEAQFFNLITVDA